MSTDTDNALSIAQGIIDMEATINLQLRTINTQDVENEKLKERLAAVNTQLGAIKDLLRVSRGMRHEDFNPIMARLEHVIAVVQGRAPASHIKKEPA